MVLSPFEIESKSSRVLQDGSVVTEIKWILPDHLALFVEYDYYDDYQIISTVSWKSIGASEIHEVRNLIS